jgi:prepilin-type processing-associated H-X9-DG protein
MKTQNINDAKRAFTILELLVVMFFVCAFFLLLFPATTKSPQRAGRIQCVNNLKQNGIAFRIWADDNGDHYPMQYRAKDFDGSSFANEKQMFIYFQVMSNELSNPKMVHCPEDDKRSAATNFTTDFNSSRVSYFVGLDANGTNVANLLAGDRNITSGIAPKNGMLEITTNQVAWTNQAVAWTKKIHKNAGNILFADGHAEQLTSSKLRESLMRSGMATNRLVFP